jgi:hypothetical protein
MDPLQRQVPAHAHGCQGSLPRRTADDAVSNILEPVNLAAPDNVFARIDHWAPILLQAGSSGRQHRTSSIASCSQLVIRESDVGFSARPGPHHRTTRRLARHVRSCLASCPRGISKPQIAPHGAGVVASLDDARRGR